MINNKYFHLASKEEIDKLNKILGILNEVHSELSDLIFDIYNMLENSTSDFDKNAYLHSLYCPENIKISIYGDVPYYSNYELYMCLVEIENEGPSAQTKVVSLPIPLNWYTADGDNCKVAIVKALCYTLKDYVSDTEGCDEYIERIQETIVNTGNVVDEYNLDVINRLIKLYNKVDDIDLGESIRVYDIASAIEDFFPNMGIEDRIVSKFRDVSNSSNYTVWQDADLIHITNLCGRNMYDNDTINVLSLDVQANLYLKSDDEIIDYFIKYRLKELNKLVVGAQARLQNILSRYEDFNDEFSPISSLFNTLNVSEKVAKYGSK